MSRITDRLRGLAASLGGGGPRVAGPPRSPNGASSFHLWWQFSASAQASVLVEVSATLEVLVPPAVPALYFWALQVDFLSAGREMGGGHTGLQWNRRYSANTAVNWGGYAAQAEGGGVLPGSISSLPGFPDDPHTLAYPWQANRPYSFRVMRSPERPGAWRAQVTNLESGEVSTIRDLYVASGRVGAGDPGQHYLVRPVVWSEVFADCDAPSVIVRWSGLQAVNQAGAIILPESVRVNYQSSAEGGCTNTSVATDSRGILQVTNAPREIPQGATLRPPG